MDHDTKNFSDQGGNRWVVGGELDVQPGATFKLNGTAVTQAADQANSTAADVATLVTDFNSLLAKLKAAGLMA
jgi:hypothetical protein